ncbi:MAG: hypothetical protein ABW118_07205 [Candidatus Thiodiazotropha sp.]
MPPEGHNNGTVAIALAIIAAIGGWGTAIITNWQVIFGNGAATVEDIEKSSCKIIEGQWKRDVDNLVVEYTQSACVITGRIITDVGANSHQIRAVLSGKSGAGYTRRSVSGCTTILSGEYELLSDNLLKIKATGNGCDLSNYQEEFVYRKIM